MKKYVTVLVIALSCYCISCTPKSQGGMSAAAQKNLDAMHGVNQCFDSKDFSKVGDYIADDAVDHAGDSGDIKGLANIKTQFEKWTTGVASQKTEVIKELADDEYVMAWQKYTGAYSSDMMGHKAGDTYTMEATEIVKFKDGKAIEHWSMMNPKDLMKMMPPPPPPPSSLPDSVKKDTSKKMM
ncbi:ester cyclase [Ferruginibacter albus]|uniref:ester cyclase n=1 Tax=Ferruginibacter albus TaxID=2875540 RepID=UPI001CC6A525|nr:ester cyclase [Ferruginibacter albus]UAY50982.1 ester cyclase [Ferruginibacter albus]